MPVLVDGDFVVADSFAILLAANLISASIQPLHNLPVLDTILSNDEDIRIDIADEHIFYIKALPMAAGSPSTKYTAYSEFKYEIIFMLDPTGTYATPNMASSNKGNGKINVEDVAPSNKIVLPQSPPAKRSPLQNPDEQPNTANKKVEKTLGDKDATALKKLI